jgi:MoaA/NifB/PqqE/SkfB family radical SAM enzyme
MATRLARLGVNNFCVTGGEPTLHSGFGQIVRHLLKTEWFDYVRLRPRPVDVSVLSNGDTDVWTADEELCALMATRPKETVVKSVSIALHGGPERHREVTGGADIAKTLATMRMLVARGVSVFANVVIGGGDAGRPEDLAIADAEQAARLAAEAGVFHIVVMRPLASGRGANEEAKGFMSLSSEAIQRALKTVSKMVTPRGGSVTLACCTPKCIVPDDGEIENLVVPRSCGCGKDTVCIDPAGLVRPCTTSEVIGGSAIVERPSTDDGDSKDDDDSDPATLAVFSQQIRAFVASAKKGERPPICKTCPHNEDCTAGCPSAHVDCGGGARADPLVLTVSKVPASK